jgi:hypothetical protein
MILSAEEVIDLLFLRFSKRGFSFSAKSKIRHSNIEARNKSKYQMTEIQNWLAAAVLVIGTL